MSAKSSLPRTVLSSPTFSPFGLTIRALVIVLSFLVFHSLGWRDHTTFISGSQVGVDTERGISILIGVAYMTAYFGAVLVSPILLLAALVLKLWNAIVSKL